VVLNDYCQNHLNDGLVTVTKTDYDIPLPSYANRTTYQCDASGQLSIVNGNLTSKQLYSANQILNTKQVNQKQNVYSSGPFTQDIFALIPVKTAGLSPGQSFIDFSGTLQNQERTYFGPVNIRKPEQNFSMIAMKVKDSYVHSKDSIVRYTLCEIHPSTIFGILASCIPFPDIIKTTFFIFIYINFIVRNVLYQNSTKI
jgi:hypothetical protein